MISIFRPGRLRHSCLADFRADQSRKASSKPPIPAKATAPHFERDIETHAARNMTAQINTDTLPIALEKDKQPPTRPELSRQARLCAISTANRRCSSPIPAHQRIVAMTPDGKIIETIGSGKTGHDDGDFAQRQLQHAAGIDL